MKLTRNLDALKFPVQIAQFKLAEANAKFKEVCDNSPNLHEQHVKAVWKAQAAKFGTTTKGEAAKQLRTEEQRRQGRVAK